MVTQTVTQNGIEEQELGTVGGVQHLESEAGIGLTISENSEATRQWIEELDRARNWMDDANPLPVRGVFAESVQLFTTYRVQIQFSHKVLGGIPRNPDILIGWLKAKVGLKDGDELKRMVAKTLQQMGVEVDSAPTVDQLDAAFQQIKNARSGNGFKFTQDRGRYLEGRQVKAALRESTNVLFAGKRWGPTKKGPKSFLAEHVFVVEDRLFFNRFEPDGHEFIVGHVSGPAGHQSTLGEYEFMVQPELTFHVLSSDDEVIAEQVWGQILDNAQHLGLGASRSMGFGRFIVTDFARLPKAEKRPFMVRTLQEGELTEEERSLV